MHRIRRGLLGVFSGFTEPRDVRFIKIGQADHTVDLSPTDPTHIVCEQTGGGGTGTYLTPATLRLPLTAPDGKRFAVRVVPTASTTYAIAVRVRGCAAKKAGVVATYTILFGQVAEFIFKAGRGWIFPAGTSAGSEPTSTAITQGDGAFARDESVSIGAGAVALGTATAGSMAIGHTARAAANRCVAIGPNSVAELADSVALGQAANCAAGTGTAIGSTASANSNGATAIGALSVADTSGTSVGKSATTGAGGVGATAIGYNANAAGKGNAVALGLYAVATRYGEITKAIDITSPNYRRIAFLGWGGTTSNATATEIFLSAVANQRAAIGVGSAFVFSIQVVARQNSTDVTKAWELTGLIKNTSAGVCSLVGTVAKNVVAADAAAATWDVAATADNTNDALILTVTGEAAKTITWAASARITEMIV